MIRRLFTFFTITLVLCACNSDEPDPDPEINPDPVGSLFSSVDYQPAPGQFVNEMPVYEKGDTPQSINRKALEAINRGAIISLGALGGQITLTLTNPIFHNPGAKYDFRILGNCYLTGTDGDNILGSAEPGIVWVMKDSNSNGIPDDKWYLFVGQMGDQIKPVTITYTPAPDPDSSRWVDWSTDDGASGALTCNTAYHNHTYFPQWLFADTNKASMAIQTYMLPPNSFREADTGLYRQICYPGFADSFPNNDDRSTFSLSDAVDLDGNPANLDCIHFIRITTAVIDSNGPLGETSTEFGGLQLP